jgi:phage tail tape-measure protein
MADLNDSTDGRVERAKDAALGKHDSNPSHVDEAGEAVGGIGGVLAGAAIGSAVGPVGTLIGGIAGAMGGWWSGRAVTEAASKLTDADDAHYRTAYESSPNRLADRSYDDVRPAYHLGHVAAHNPDYANKEWKDVQADLQRGWSADHAKKYGEWSTVSSYAGEGYTRGRSTLGTMGASAAAGASALGNKAANVVDDMKDRVDGNPASKPGADATDSARRMDSR